MNKLKAILQLALAAILVIAAAATLVNLILITMRPETISVVNAIIGQGVLIICLLVISRILFRNGKMRFKVSAEQEPDLG
jgi:membrane protein YdbS with pleckstrin-like domain|tara:strand:- start:312 stop:551 length:240 start_codon:yes stop_codon:yes gene_type:complete